MGAATKGRSTGKSGTARTSSKTAASKAKPETGEQGESATTASRRAETAKSDAERGEADGSGVAQTSGGAITEPATSSQQAAEQRQKVSAASPASAGGAASAKQADEAKVLSLPEQPVTEATAPGIAQREMELSRHRADLVAKEAALTSEVGRGTAEPGKPERRTFTRLQAPPAQPQQNVIEHEEIAIHRGDRDFVFRQDFGGHVELLWSDPSKINALRGEGPESGVIRFTPEEWAAIKAFDGASDGAGVPESQSAAEQRQGVATEGGDPGPTAPLPVVAR